MSNIATIVTILISVFLTVHVSAEQMGMTPSSGPSGAPDCMTNLMNMTSCLSYVEVGEGGGAVKPDKECCPSLAGLVESSPQCLCYLLSGDLAAQFGIKIDKPKALKLPKTCGVVTPDPSLCSLFGVPIGAPAGAPAGAPVAIGNKGLSPALAPIMFSGAEAPGGLASGPSSGRTGNALITGPYSVFLNFIISPLAFALHFYF